MSVSHFLSTSRALSAYCLISIINRFQHMQTDALLSLLDQRFLVTFALSFWSLQRLMMMMVAVAVSQSSAVVCKVDAACAGRCLTGTLLLVVLAWLVLRTLYPPVCWHCTCACNCRQWLSLVQQCPSGHTRSISALERKGQFVTCHWSQCCLVDRAYCVYLSLNRPEQW